MSDLTVNEWTEFLNARIAQEKGDDEGALKVFERLAKEHPHDPHLKAARGYALQRLGRYSDDTAGSAIAARYAALGQTLVGEADTPEAWVATLTDLVKDAERGAAGERLAAAVVAW